MERRAWKRPWAGWPERGILGSVMTTTAKTEYEPVIGLEVHAQLLTRSKMFSRCPTDYQTAPPNSRVDPVSMGLPGALPVINRTAVEYTVMTGIALHCVINEHTKFDRKNYPYPDLVKGFQISQYDEPIASNGWLEIEAEDGGVRRAGITRVHLEEDTAKLLHRAEPGGEGYSLVDLNRSGIPLMEIVGEPDLRSAEEARHYLVKLRAILQYLGVSTGSMEEGSFRCDANVSLRPKGTTELPPTKVEVKNMNSFRSVYQALLFEIERQTARMGAGERIVQETRGWNEARAATVSQRSKEQAHDYRYLPEPDLPPLALAPAWVEEIAARLPELPDARGRRFQDQYGLSDYDAAQLTSTKPMADFFEGVVKVNPSADEQPRAKAAANWVLGEVSRLLNEAGKEIGDEGLNLSPVHLAEVLDLIDAKTITGNVAKEVFEESFATGKAPGAIVKEKGLTQISAADDMLPIVDAAIAGNDKAVADYRAGKETAIKFLVGQVMKATKGRANPGVVTEMLRERLGG